MSETFNAPNRAMSFRIFILGLEAKTSSTSTHLHLSALLQRRAEFSLQLKCWNCWQRNTRLPATRIRCSNFGSQNSQSGKELRILPNLSVNVRLLLEFLAHNSVSFLNLNKRGVSFVAVLENPSCTQQEQSLVEPQRRQLAFGHGWDYAGNCFADAFSHYFIQLVSVGVFSSSPKQFNCESGVSVFRLGKLSNQRDRILRNSVWFKSHFDPVIQYVHKLVLLVF